MKKILLIPALNIDTQQISLYTPYGLLSLQAVAHEFGEGVDIFTPSIELLKGKYTSSWELVESIVNEIDLRAYDVIGLSTVCNSFHHSLRIAQLIKARVNDILICMGGPHISAVCKSALKLFKEIDAIFVGEAEISFSAYMLRRRDGTSAFDGIPGILTRNYALTPQTIISNLDELPFIDAANSYIDIVSLARQYSKRFIFPIEASRGCPFECDYCSTKPYWGGKVRRKSPARLITEMRRMFQLSGQSVFSFLGDNFGSPTAAFLDFCNTIQSDAPNFRWGCSLRMDKLETHHLQTIWNSGCRALFAGIESASQETLNKANKNAALEKELQIVKCAIEMGFEVITSFIIGFPWETKDDILKTYELHCEMLKVGAVRSRIGLLCPLPGAKGFRDSKVLFDQWTSSVALDDLPMDDELWEMIRTYPDIFLQMGHYMTPHLSRIDIVGVLDAAFRINYLYARDRGSEKLWVG